MRGPVGFALTLIHGSSRFSMFTFWLTFHVMMLSSLSPGPSPGPGLINVYSERNLSKEGLILIFDKKKLKTTFA